LGILVEMLRGLRLLHDNGITHGDLNPNNVILDEDGHVLIGDYAFLSVREKSRKGQPEPTYMSPEQLKKESIGLSTDTWSLGCILYELCCLKVQYRLINSHHMKRRVTKINIRKLKRRSTQQKEYRRHIVKS
jgi:NIMA (never in mitosis gene a)-related kinase